MKSVKDLVNKYEQDFDGVQFANEMEHFRSAIEPFLEHGKSLEKTNALDILNILFCNGLQYQFANTCSALTLFLTLPFTVASNERAFSKLKIIKNYLRSSMAQDRLSNLCILAIEHKYTENMSYDAIVDEFAISKCRKVCI